MVDMFVSVHVEESKFVNMHETYVSKKIEIKTNASRPICQTTFLAAPYGAYSMLFNTMVLVGKHVLHFHEITALTIRNV